MGATKGILGGICLICAVCKRLACVNIDTDYYFDACPFGYAALNEKINNK